MINSLIPRVMTASLTQAQSQAQVQRKIDTAKLIDFYHGHQIQDLKADLVQYSGNVEQLKPVCVNVVKKINNRLAQVYNKPATRAVTGTDQDQEVFNLIQNQARMNVKMKQASRFTKLVKTVLIRVLFRNGKLELDILTPDIVDVETGTSPEDLKAVIVTHYPASGNVRETQYHRWTANTFQVLNYKGDIISSETNEYGILPFVALHDACPVDEFFQPIPEDLASLQESINLKISDLLHTISFQSHGQPVSKGLPDKQTNLISSLQTQTLKFRKWWRRSRPLLIGLISAKACQHLQSLQMPKRQAALPNKWTILNWMKCGGMILSCSGFMNPSCSKPSKW
jgi:hypothetical protein